MNEVECRRIVRERSDGICEMCGIGGDDLTLHHRRKRSAGGPWSPSNCVMVHGSGTTKCHGWIEAHPKAAMESGWWVSRYGDEREVPIAWWDGSTVLLDDDGNVWRL